MHRTAAYSQEEIVRLVKTFAYAKVLATTSKMNEHRDLFTHFWVVTRVSVGHTWRDKTELRQWIDAEVRFAQEKLKQAALAGPRAFAQCLESMHTATRKFFSTYAAMQAETAKINEDASNVLGFSARSAAVALAAANISLAWMGLLSGPAVVGINMAGRSFLVAAGDVTYSFLGKKIAVGVIGAFGTRIVTDWAGAMNAEFAMAQATNNAPGFVDDSWRLFFAALNNTTLARLEGVYRSAVNEVAKKADAMYQPGMTALSPATERAAAERAAAVKQAQAVEQQLANFKGQGGSMGMQVGKACMKVAAWGLTIQSTVESLKALQTQWNYKM